MAREKEKKIDFTSDNIPDLISKMTKTLGAEVVKLGNTIVNVKAVPTGIPTLDLALGCKGLPRGRFIEVYGAESSGKTTTMLNIIATCQKTFFEEKGRNGIVAFIDAEHALDLDWAKKIGVDINNLIVSQPDSGEGAFKTAEAFVQSGLVDLVVIDSVAGLIPQAVIDGDYGDNFIGAQARLMSQSLPKINRVMSKNGATVVFINQVREKVGVMFGNPEITPGGRALKFFASVRVEIKKTETVRSGDISIANNVRAKIVKNKVAPPFKTAEYSICFGTPEMPVYGVDPVSCLFTASVDSEVIKRKGSNYYFKDLLIGSGEAKSVMNIRSDEILFNAIRDTLLSNALTGATIIDEDDVDDDADTTFTEADEDSIQT